MIKRIFYKLIEYLGETDRIYFMFGNRVFKPTDNVTHFPDSIIIALEEVE